MGDRFSCVWAVVIDLRHIAIKERHPVDSRGPWRGESCLQVKLMAVLMSMRFRK